MHQRQVIFRTAFFSRCLTIVLQYLFNVLLPDHNADAFRYPESLENTNVLDKLVRHLFGGFLRWDAHHMMHISRYGYTYEHTLAFFPLYSYSVKIIAEILSMLLPLHIDSLTLLVFLIFNVIFFTLSAVCLYDLSLQILNKDLALKAAVLFCYNPASVFFSAPYTETLFSYLTFKTMLNCVLLYKKYSNVNATFSIKDAEFVITIGLSTLTRSNGILNLGFLGYLILSLYFDKCDSNKFNLKLTIKYCALMAILILVSCLPFILFQIFSYLKFCTNFEIALPEAVLNHKDVKNFVLPGTFEKHNQSWCHQKIPLAYSYIQKHYWKVGFLEYYEFKQIPNFILASPIISIILVQSFQFFKKYPKDLKLFNFKLLGKKLKHEPNFPLMLVFVIHGAALTVFCLLNIHVQVITRMLCSATPLLYWFCSFYVGDVNKNLFKKMFNCSTSERAILCYFLGYFVIGSALFCNFLPWT